MTKKPKESRDPTDSSHPLYEPTEDPTHRFYLGSETEGEQKPDQPDPSAYKVGPGFPPNEHKWKKGCPSPYPKGRPKKVPSMDPAIRKIFEDALNAKVHVTKADKKIILTKLAIGFEQLATQWAKGDRHARRDVFTFAAMVGLDLQGKDLITEALGIDEQAILDEYVRRRQQSSLGATPDDHVKAPPDLVDDDVTKPESNETPAAKPRSDRLKPLEPELDEHGRPKARDRAFIQRERERNIAQQKKNQEGS